jgi:hypothetical protein
VRTLNIMTGYDVAQTMVHVLKECGDDLTRANIMKQAASIKSLQMEGLLPRRHDQHPAQLISLRSSNFGSGNSRPSVGNCSAMSSVARSAGRA